MTGITAYGAYIPRLRLSRQAAAAATGWLNPALYGAAQGERALANWDEDPITMAVAAGRDCLGPHAGGERISALYFASTSAPFSLRLNASVVSAALGMQENISAADFGSSTRSGVSALIQACDHASAHPGAEALAVASELPRSPAASAHAMRQGDAAAALNVGTEGVLAEILGTAASTVDFVDSFRGTGHDHTQHWEERWVRDEGYLKLVPPVLGELLQNTQVAPDSIDGFICPCPFRGTGKKIAKMLGIPAEALVDHLENQVGDSGAAQPLLLISHWLEQAKPGQRLLVAAFGQGCEAVLLETTPECGNFSPARGPRYWLDQGVAEPNYFKYLVYRNLVDWDRGADGEDDKKTLLSSLYRDRGFINTLQGWHSTEDGETYFGAEGEFKAQRSNKNFVRRSFCHSNASILTFSANNLGMSLDQAIVTGVVEFEEGGRLVMNFTETDDQKLAIGCPLEMSYRIHAVDKVRGFTRYFWKAKPVPSAITREDAA